MRDISFVNKLPASLRFVLLKFMYKLRKKSSLKSFKDFKNNFFLYEIDNYFVPSESIGWFVDYNYYKSWVGDVSGWSYLPKDGDTIIDIGAGIGEEVIIWSELVGKNGKVFSIEANPDAFEVLTEVKLKNGLENVYLFNIAISEKDELVQLYKSENIYLEGSVEQGEANGEYYEIEGKTLRQFIIENEVNRVDLLKCNIEGAERFVVSSVGDKIGIIQNVAIACHDFRWLRENNSFFKTKTIVFDFLIKNGFDITHQTTGKGYIDDWLYGRKK